MTRKRSFYLGSSSMTPAERAKGRFMRAPDDHPAAPVTPPAGETPPADPPAPATEPVAASFDDAFAAAAKAGDTPPAAAPTPATPPAPETPPAAPAPATPPAPETPPAAPTPSIPVPSADDIVRGLAEKLATPAAPAAPAPAAPAAEPEQPSLYTPDEQKVLADYASNWPDVQKAEQLTRRAEYHDLLAYVFKEVQKHTAPAFEQLRQMGNTMHTGEVKALVPDYTPAVETEVNTWIDTQPSYLQAAYKQVMQQGTSDEVADLIGRYRAATGAAPAPAAPATPAPAAAPAAPAKPGAPAKPAKTELSEAAKQAVSSLAPVGGERSQVPAGEDQQDFGSAFAKYAATMQV